MSQYTFLKAAKSGSSQALIRELDLLVASDPSHWTETLMEWVDGGLEDIDKKFVVSHLVIEPSQTNNDSWIVYFELPAS